MILPPFEMAIRLGGARSVMPTYIDLDGVPATADGELIGGLLRTELGFDGLVVSDYYAVSFLEQQHSVAASPSEAGAAALHAGIDVELPAVRCYGTPLRKAIAAGLADEAVVDRAAARVLTRKCELGMLDPDWTALPSPEGTLQAPRLTWTRRSTGSWPAGWPRNRWSCWPTPGACSRSGPAREVAVVGPLADDPLAFFGCYSMPRHLGEAYPEAAASVPVATLLSALRVELAAAGAEPAGRTGDGELRARLRRPVAGQLGVRRGGRRGQGGGGRGRRGRGRGRDVRARHVRRGL